jgi:hypothetical protein
LRAQTLPEDEHRLVPRPGHTPEALRAALAVVAPGRLAEMQATKDEAFARAIEWQSVSVVQSWGADTREQRHAPCVN